MTEENKQTAEIISTVEALNLFEKASISINENCPQIASSVRTLKWNDHVNADINSALREQQAQAIATGADAVAKLGDVVNKGLDNLDSDKAANDLAVKVCAQAGYLK